MQKIILLILTMFQITNSFARECDNQVKAPARISNMESSADVMSCIATKEAYKCDSLLPDLEDNEKSRVIQCDSKSLEANRLGNMKFLGEEGCIWNGVKMSLEQLKDLQKLGEAISKGIAENFACDNSPQKKRELMSAYNLTMPDPRFKFPIEQRAAWFESATCGEVKQKVFDLHNAATSTYQRESVHNKNATKRNWYAGDNKSGIVDFSKMVKDTIAQAMKEAETNYQCFTPKFKAEVMCSAVTSILIESATGAGGALAVKRVLMVVKSKKALNRARNAIAEGKKIDLKDASQLLPKDRIKAAEALLNRTLEADEKSAILKAHKVGKKRGFGNYTEQDITDKARAMREPGTIDGKERRALMENGITGNYNLKYDHPFRVEAQKKLNNAFEVGNKEKVAESMKEAKKHYEELANMSDKDFNKHFTPDSSGISNVITGNEYGLNVKASVKSLERIAKSNDIDLRSTYRRGYLEVDSHLKELNQILAKKPNSQLEYKIHRAKELRAELLEKFYETKYSQFNQLDIDAMPERDLSALRTIKDELAESRAVAEKRKWPNPENN